MAFPKYVSVSMDHSEGSAASINDDISQLSESQTQRCIYRVHKHLRNINNKAYDPEIITIGPYHHHRNNKDTYKMMEEHKLRYLKAVLGRKNQKVEQYTSAIGKLEKRARDCYGEPISLNKTEFTKMLVLDGCFIIELLSRWVPLVRDVDSHRENDPIFQMNWIMDCLKRDLILFENQIPFFVLCKLFDLIAGPNRHNVFIYFILNFLKSVYPGTARLQFRMDREWGEIKHLLHLIHTSSRPPSFDTTTTTNNNNNNACLDGEWRFIPSATQLTDANVTFSRPEEPKSLFHVGFEKGKMVIPPFSIEDWTECVFRNLLAYEQYFPDSSVNFITDYVSLLDCLINSSGDVEILSECQIINNWLGENEVVARMFNRLLDSVTYSVQQSMYVGMMDRVNEHYRRPWNRAEAKLRRDYFNSPWAYFTVASAVVLLLLTLAQTVLSALQLI